MADFVQDFTNHLMGTIFDPNHYCDHCEED